jgi:methyl-accepting chemotaxis protein
MQNHQRHPQSKGTYQKGCNRTPQEGNQAQATQQVEAQGNLLLQSAASGQDVRVGGFIMDYGRYIIDNTVEAEQSDIEVGTEFMELVDVESMLDEIEKRVNEINDMLREITGLTEIDEIKTKVELLSKDLY